MVEKYMTAGDTPSVINKQTMLLLPPLTEEYIEKSKFDRWVTYFFDKNNKETYLNRTKSALKVYDCKNYHSAGNIGYENWKKLGNWQAILRNYAEEMGVTIPVMFRKALDKYDKTNNPEWMKIAMRMMGAAEIVEDLRNNQTLIQQNLQVNQNNMNVQVVTYKDAGTENNNTSVQLQSPELPASTS